MATSFQYVVFPHHMKNDNTIPVKVRMTHNRKTKYFPTSIAVTKKQLTRKMDKISDTQILEAVNRRVDVFRRAASVVDGAEWMTADELYGHVLALVDSGGKWTLDFFEYSERKMADMKPKTAEGYRSSVNALKRFLGRDSLDINEITYRMMLQFRDALEKDNGKGCRAASYYLGCLRHLHNLAREEYNDDDIGLTRIPRKPFRNGLIPPQPMTEHRDLTLGQLMDVLGSTPKTSRGKLALDVFTLSFGLVGMNTADMYWLRESDLKDGILTYNRLKTESRRRDKAVMKVRIEDELRGLLEKYKGLDGYLLNFAQRYSEHHNFNQAVNKGLKEVGEIAGVEGLTSYHARHTWATLARNVCGISFETVHESLNHVHADTDRITDIYIEKDWSRVWEANRAVLDLVYHQDAVAK